MNRQLNGIIILLFSILIFNFVYYFHIVSLLDGSDYREYHFQRSPNELCKNIDFINLSARNTAGSSMNPTFFAGDLIYIREFNASYFNVQEGDILSVRVGNKSVSHRVTAVYPDKFYMKGDNNFITDNRKYSYENVNGVVCGWKRNS